MNQFLRFMVDELRVCTREEAVNRVFFVSAREVLQHRLKSKGQVGSPGVFFAEGHQVRMMEFEDFEKQFEVTKNLFIFILYGRKFSSYIFSLVMYFAISNRNKIRISY